MGPWLRFFRAVNLPTVPGDVLVGVAAVVWGCAGVHTNAISLSFVTIAAACLAACFLYLFGMADNDIVGADSDGSERPIPAGMLSLRAARLARGICLFGALVAGALGNLPPAWWIAAFGLAVAIVVYNRTKWSALMGLCRGLDVLCGGAALVVGAVRGVPGEARLALAIAVAVWTLYVMSLTICSAGEDKCPARRSFVGFLIGAIVYLQLGALLFFYLDAPCAVLRNLLLGGAFLLIALRLAKRLLPGVSAS